MSASLTLDLGTANTPLGMDTMSAAFPQAHRYHEWVYSSFRDLLEGRILEVGIGSGIYTRMLLRHGPVVATDLDDRCLDRVRAEHRGAPLECFKLDLANAEDFAALRQRPFDTAVCLHVLEHVRDDAAAMRNLAGALRPGGKVILYVPAMPSIYGTLDVGAGHHRRYRRRSLLTMVESAGFKIIRARYQNALCVLGWWVNGRLLRRTDISAESLARQIRFFDKYLVPPARVLDRVTRGFMGQSLIVAAEKRFPVQAARADVQAGGGEQDRRAGRGFVVSTPAAH